MHTDGELVASGASRKTTIRRILPYGTATRIQRAHMYHLLCRTLLDLLLARLRLALALLLTLLLALAASWRLLSCSLPARCRGRGRWCNDVVTDAADGSISQALPRDLNDRREPLSSPH